ncbi:MAG: GAF domain-containing sensor histidine kinase, partial [Anaerolineales bacterium]|nr:GAF domain-containing sensor histidine kinase [Anaerolineales bacterium]
FNQGDFIAVFDNITERKQAEEKNSRQMTNLQTLYEGARNLAESLDLSSLSEGVTRTCVDVFGIRLAWIGFAEPDGSVSVMNHYPAHIQYPHTIEERWDDAPRGHGPTGRAIRSALPQVITDINQAPEYIPWRIAALREGFCTSAAFPLISRDMAFGVLNLYSDQPGSFTPERVEFFQAYANQAAAALEKGRLFADLQSAHTRLRELSTRLVEIEEEQRHEIARELHDSVGQSLTALNINLSIIQDQFAGQASASTSVRLADSVKLVEQAVERIRDVMAELRPPVLDDYGLLPALRWYAEQYTGRTNIRAVVLEPQVVIPRLPPSVETALFRISQETLTNISRHAEASQVSLSLDMVDGSPHLTIQDDGIGFDPSLADTGWGLRIMRERAEAVGGKLVVESSPGKGSKVVVDVPLPQARGKELPEKQEGI